MFFSAKKYFVSSGGFLWFFSRARPAIFRRYVHQINSIDWKNLEEFFLKDLRTFNIENILAGNVLEVFLIIFLIIQCVSAERKSRILPPKECK